jgi:hypothetical protein
MKKNIFCLFATGVLLAGCSQPISHKTNMSPTGTQQVSTQSQQASAIARSAILNAVPGQKFGNMVYKKTENNNATFSGKTEVAGQYAVSDLDGNLCFYPDRNSKSKVPDLRTGDSSGGYFCFSNKEQALKLLGSKNGNATVIISGYSDMTVDSSQPPFTELLQVITKYAPRM